VVAAVEEAILVATGAEGSVALTDLETAEDSVDPQEEGSVIATAELETVASGEEGPRHQEVNRVVSEEDSEEGEIMMVMAAGPEMNDPAADAMTTAPRLRVAASHRGTATEANSGAVKAPAEDAVANPAARDSADRHPPAASGEEDHHHRLSISEEGNATQAHWNFYFFLVLVLVLVSVFSFSMSETSKPHSKITQLQTNKQTK